MTTHKEALMKARDALKELVEKFDSEQFTSICELDPAKDAIAAAEEALAQQEQNTVEAVKTVLKGIDQTEIESQDGWWETSAGAEFGAKKLKSVIGLLAQPEQEPVAWLHWLHGPVRLFMNKDEATLELERLNREYPVDEGHRKMRPLVFGDTTPPQRTWVGLTDEQLTNIITTLCNTDDGTCDTRVMCRAIEAAHGIK